MDALTRQLKERFGFAAFRHGQEDVIRAVLAGRDAMAVMPTGQGKSLCYQLPATLLPGLTLVISPLIALMQDQVTAMRQRKIAAAAFHSGLAALEKSRVMQDLRQRRVQLLYLAPERMQHEGFLRLLRSLWVSLLVVDEAHCISQWGHDFRPDYLKIGRLRQELTNPPCLALTATATTRVQSDICQRLSLRDPFQLVAGFRRANLAFSVHRCEFRQDKLATLGRLVREVGKGTILVYCATRRAVEEVAAWLGQSHASAGYYHAGLSDEERRLVHDDFRRGSLRILVATNAFGMGIDKSDVRLVVHFDVPGSLEAYYQEAGRAGRDGRRAACALLFHERDVATQEYFIEQASKDPDGGDRAGRMKTLLHEMLGYVSASTCRQLAILEYFSDEAERALGFCGLCDRCVAPVLQPSRTGSRETAVSAREVLETVSWSGGRFGLNRIVDILRGSRSKALLACGAEDSPTYGICRAQAKPSVTARVKGLIDSGYLQVEGTEYPTLEVTRKGREVLQGISEAVLEQVEGQQFAGSVLKPRRSSAALEGIPETMPPDRQLVERLRQLRSELAEEEGVAPFLIFHDTTLKAIAVSKPGTTEALLEVPGIGERKAERYGRRVLAVVNGDE
ncbi:MAG: ATP-dependent DNA helicase RecQ [Nitrospira sp.]|nr:ATP-dependent DNA helicase RecQ [Nitrospira sp.]